MSCAASAGVAGFAAGEAQPCWELALRGEVFEVPALTQEGEALVVWLHGVGDTGQGRLEALKACEL